MYEGKGKGDSDLSRKDMRERLKMRVEIRRGKGRRVWLGR